MFCHTTVAGVACRPQQAACDAAEASFGLRGPGIREVRAWRGKSRTVSRKLASDQGKSGLACELHYSRNLAQEWLAARGYFPARRERGNVQTEHVVGRHRLTAIESSVVKVYIKQRMGPQG